MDGVALKVEGWIMKGYDNQLRENNIEERNFVYD